MSTGMAIQFKQTRQAHATAKSAHRTPAGVILARCLVVAGIVTTTACCPRLSPPAAMWLVALAMYAGFKALTFLEYQAASPHAKLSLGRSIGYLFAWAGMDPTDLASHRPAPRHPSVLEWVSALLTAVVGFALIAVAPLASTSFWLVGAIGLVGFLLAFHFGSFQLLALAWRRAGINVPALMQHPERSASLADFWGRRWNTAYRRLSFDYFFRPFVRRLGAGGALIVAFLISGVIHELVITWPAGGGYGGPTVFFLLQGLAMAFERSRWGASLLPVGSMRARVFAAAFVLLPAPLLFPPPFLVRVIAPMTGVPSIF
ncbi:MAG TPA: MBOAT family protein [Planctomycetaceae bacterium]|nr:MBOAT family protein [Planctomycetaceae bacterium]